MSQFLRIASVVAAFVVILVAGAVVGGVVMVQMTRGRFERFSHERQEEQRQREEENHRHEAEQQQLMRMIGSLRVQLQQVQQQSQQGGRGGPGGSRGLPQPQQFGPQLMQRFINQIKATPEEREKIRPLVNQAAEDLRRLRRDTTHSTEVILEHLEDQIAAILDPAQRDRFSDLIQRWRDAFQKYNFEQQQRQAQQRLLEQQGLRGQHRGSLGQRGSGGSNPEPLSPPATPVPPAPAAGARDGNLSVEMSMAKITVTGAIQRPGSYDPDPGTTLSLVQLITQAGGLTPAADGTNVGITRSGDPTKAIQHVDVSGIMNGTAKLKADDASLLLHAGDLVFVPEKKP
jgi:hypothetical protein